MANKWTPETPWFKSKKKTQAVWPTYVCRNKNCKSYGKSHPNCKCGIPSFAQQSKNLEYDASGGSVGRQFCMDNVAHSPDCEHFADGGHIEETNHIIDNPSHAIDHSVVSDGLHHLLTRTGHSKSEDPYRVMDEHRASIGRGRKAVYSHTKNLLETSKEHQIESNPEHVEALKSHLEDLRTNPHKLLDIGGDLGSHLPDHAGLVAAKAATALNYYETIRPKMFQVDPMSDPIKPSKMDEAHYNRQLGIMQSPATLFNGVKNGTVSPADIATVQTVYPKLFEELKNKAFDTVVEAKASGKQIPYKQRLSLGLLLGQPLDYTQSAEAMQSIVKANVGAQSQTQEQPGKKSGATAVAMKQINKNDAIAATPIEASEISQKTKI